MIKKLPELLGDRSVAKSLFKFELFPFFLLFIHINCIVLPYVTIWYFFLFFFFLPSTSNQKYLMQINVISHIGKTFYCCSVLPSFSIKVFFFFSELT